MKTAIAILTSAAVLGLSSRSASAGDREWATAGKVLTGLAAGAVIVKAFESPPIYTTTYYSPPVVQAPVVVAAPAPVVVQPAPVVVYSQPIYVQPAPVYVQAVPVYVAPPPLVSFGIGFGHHHHHFAAPVFRFHR